MPSFAERLKNLRLAMRLSQADMAARLGVSKDYVWQLEAETKKPGPKLVRELELLERAPGLPQKTPAEELMRDVRLQLRYIPLLSFAQAGAATAYEELPTAWQETVPTDVADPKAFAVTLVGDSMEPKYLEGEIAILRPSSEPRPSSLVVARLKDGGVFCKLYSRTGDLVTFRSYNRAYDPITVHASEVSWVYPVDSVMKRVWQ